jgi:hypothetical protein
MESSQHVCVVNSDAHILDRHGIKKKKWENYKSLEFQRNVNEITFILIIFINLHSFSNKIILHEENNSLNLKVLTLLQQ